MKEQKLFRLLSLCCILISSYPGFAWHVMPNDTCNANDICETATLIPNVLSDDVFVCITSCNTGAAPEAFTNSCNIGDFPTTWFMIQTDGVAALINIHIGSDDIDAPVINLFLANPDCSDLIPVSLTASNLPCVVGSNGKAEAIGSEVSANSIYFIAISAVHWQTGEFDLCINTVSAASACVTSRNIEIISRTEGGPLDGPFYAGETVSICMNVNSYSAVNTGCSWFQGVIPVFGNGWDPASFDAWGQPLNATINGNPMGQANNGLYGTSTWDWFADVDYHYDHPFLQGGDFDGNGTYELCNLLYEADCPNTGGLYGGCCSPCWGSSLGTILPPGWFAYGINGSCPTPGPPIRVDWGDGNSCSGGMGPWRFCFDLTVRDYPHCLDDHTTSNLSLGFFTTADSETGAWTGSLSICTFDQPAKITLPMKCGEEIFLATEVLPALCSGDTLMYTISHPEAIHWEWDIWPGGHVQQPVYHGENGIHLNHVVTNTTNAAKTITYTFSGDIPNSDNVLIKQMKFTVYPQIKAILPKDLLLCERDTSTHFISPDLSGGSGNYEFHWQPYSSTTLQTVSVRSPFPKEIVIEVNDELGCYDTDTMHISTRPCHLIDTGSDNEVSNDPDTLKDSPPPVLPFTEPETILARSVGENQIRVAPVPAHDLVIITLQQIPGKKNTMYIADVNGHVVRSLHEEQQLHTRMRVNISDLVPGVYYLHYHSGVSINTARVVKL